MAQLNENESYSDFVKEHIELDKLLYNLPKEKQLLIKKLLNKKISIRKSNKIFAEYRINRINKKINNIKNSK
ncbi:MAG: hypothetical protein ACI4UE_06070 [Candidatus Scatovivens sp.]